MSINFPVPISITNSGDSDYNDTTILLHADGSNNSNNTGTFVDASTNTFIITRAGTPAQGSVNPFGANWSAYFSGASTGTVYVSTATTSSFAFGINNFTIEAWINSASTVSNYPLIIGNYATTFTTNSWGLYYNRIDTGNFYFSASNGSMTIASGSTYVVAGWNHVAVVRNGSTVSLFVNGTQTGSYNYGLTGLDGGTPTRLFIGNAGGTDSTTRFNGYISNLRIVNGSAIYTSNFSPSTESLTTVTNTALLTLSSNNFKDVSTNSFITTASSGVSIQRFNPFGNTQTYSISSNTIQGSTYFNGSTGYLTIGSASNWTFLHNSTVNFTVEAWVYQTSYVTEAEICNTTAGSAQAGFEFALNTNQLGASLTGAVFVNFYNGTVGRYAYLLTAGGLVGLNTWTHVAFSYIQSINTGYISVNGQISTSGSFTFVGGGTFSASNPTYPLNVSKWASASGGYLPGHISNLRITRGSALYTATFIPSVVPLTTGTQTTLLALVDSQAITDISTNTFAITVAGTAVPSLRTPFARVDASTAATLYGGSVYFNGSTDYFLVGSTVGVLTPLTTAGAFMTIEAWVYATSLRAGSANDTHPSIVGLGGVYMNFGVANGTPKFMWYNGVPSGTSIDSTISITVNTWNHLAVVFNGSGSNNLKIYVNGVLGGTGTFTNISWGSASNGNDLYIGAVTNNQVTSCWPGYISNVRITNSALYTASFTPSTTPLTTSSQSSTSTVFLLPGLNAGIYDSTMQNNLITVGSSRVSSTSTSLVKFGSGSVYLDGSGYISSPYSSSWILSGNFTIECWLYWSAHGSYGGIVGSANNNTGAAITAGWFLDFNSTNNTIQFEGQGSVSIITTNVIPQNQWVHIAVVRSGSTITHYLNGTANGSGTSSQVFNSASYPLYVGVDRGATSYLTGYIDDLRITNYVARYTATFTPPTASFADIQLLTTATVLQFTTSTNIGSVTLSYNTFTTRWSGISLPTSPTNLTPMNIQDQNNTSTGYFSLPSGTTDQRPGAPQGGYMRFNTTLDSVEYYNSITGWTTIP